ncbi:hypothetical protein Tco_0979627 [Tanacetum coccineum]
MADFVPSRAVIDAAHRKRGKYMAKCAAIGYEFLPFSFSSLGELEADAPMPKLQCASDGPMRRPCVEIIMRKEAPMGFLLEDGKDLRPADLLLLNWL